LFYVEYSARDGAKNFFVTQPKRFFCNDFLAMNTHRADNSTSLLLSAHSPFPHSPATQAARAPKRAMVERAAFERAASKRAKRLVAKRAVVKRAVASA